MNFASCSAQQSKPLSHTENAAHSGRSQDGVRPSLHRNAGGEKVNALKGRGGKERGRVENTTWYSVFMARSLDQDQLPPSGHQGLPEQPGCWAVALAPGSGALLSPGEAWPS